MAIKLKYVEVKVNRNMLGFQQMNYNKNYDDCEKTRKELRMPSVNKNWHQNHHA